MLYKLVIFLIAAIMPVLGSDCQDGEMVRFMRDKMNDCRIACQVKSAPFESDAPLSPYLRGRYDICEEFLLRFEEPCRIRPP